MKRIRCIAIDDEPMALIVIEQFCMRKGDMDILSYSEPRTGLEAILETRPDIVFLDIQMNGMDGLKLAEYLPDGCCLIFTTAYAQYALDGFELDAVDFLHKPFAYGRFEKAVDKAIRRIEAIRSEKRLHITIKQEYNNVVIFLDDILYLEAMENYTKVYLKNGKCILTRMPLKKVQDMLPDSFMRVHKSYVVPLSSISGYTHSNLRIEGCRTLIPVGRTYADAFYGMMKEDRRNPE